MRRRHAAPRRRDAIIGLSLAILSVIAMGIAVSLITQEVVAPAAAPDRPIYPEPAPGADPVQAATDDQYEPPTPSAGQPLELSIPSAGLDVSVGSMGVPDDGRIDPPTPGSAYWIRDYGRVGPGSERTAYIAGHTYRGNGSAVFNPLFDRDSHDSLVKIGDVVDVVTVDASYRYIVTAVARYPKATVDQQAELWQNVPGRLVVVACQYNGDASSTDNLVIYTQLEPA